MITSNRLHAFTLIELICVIAIIALLASLLVPVVGGVMDNAQTTRCIANLKQLGSAVHAYANDHDNLIPRVETDPTNPVYSPDAEAKPLAIVLKPYFIGPENLQCPADMKAKLNLPKDGGAAKSFWAEKGTSYEWRPYADDELINMPKVYMGRAGGDVQGRNVPQSRVRILVDYVNAGEAPHNRGLEGSSYNNLFLDGSVRTMTIRKTDDKTKY